MEALKLLWLTHGIGARMTTKRKQLEFGAAGQRGRLRNNAPSFMSFHVTSHTKGLTTTSV